MTARERYFDNAATTPLDPRVLQAMLPFLGDSFGNANSLHTAGLKAQEAVEEARAKVALAIGADDPSQIYFTSGATESNNWVLKAADHVWISPFEHSSLRTPALATTGLVLRNEGMSLDPPFELDRASEDQQSGLDRMRSFGQDIDAGMRQSRTMVSVISVNNEVGSIFDAVTCKGNADLAHSDITQAVGKISVDVSALDFASFSAHKLYGPKGIGALYCKNQPPPPLVLGGEQEHGSRGGTLNVPAIVGMGVAAEIAANEQSNDYESATKLKQILLDRLGGVDMQVNGGSNVSPFILSLSFRGVEGESLVLELDRAGYAISAGAACSSRSTEPSHVLTALKLEQDWLRGTIRISLGRFNTEQAAEGLAKSLLSAIEMFRTL